MSLARAFALSSILLAVAAFAGLAFAADLSPWMIFLGWAAFGLCLAQTMIDIPRAPWLFTLRLSPVAWNVLLVVAFIAFWIDLFWISQELLPAGIHFLIALIVNKLFNLRQRRDFLHLYAVSLMAILASAAMTVHIWYAPLLLAYLFAGVWTLLLYHLTKEREDRAARGEGSVSGCAQEIGWMTARFFWTTNAMAAAALCFTISIFFLIPRVGFGFLKKAHGESLRISGFTEKVDLGVMGPVKQDPSIVMRVELPDGPSQPHEPLYLRGMAYDRYNGRSWTNSLLNRRNLTERPQGLFTVRANHGLSRAYPAPQIRQDILLEALDTAVLFGAPQAVSISGDFLTVQSDSMGVLYLPFPSSGRVQYSVRSQPPRILPADATAVIVTYPEFVRRQYLQLPAFGPEVARLSRDVIHTSRSVHESALLIKRHLLENYRYSLDIESGRSPHPLEDFLFTRKTGYCEHYATAMVVMLRSVGIPARLVTGFLATEWNGFGQYYTVRQRDAHAWVEVYFPGSGWITFDPTPPEAASPATPWWRSLEGAVDSMRLRWDQLIIQYSAADQLSVIHGVRDGGEALRSKFGEAMAVSLDPLLRSIKKGFALLAGADLRQAGLMALVIGSSLVVLVVLVRIVSIRKPRSLCDSPGHLIAAQWYGQLLRLTAARGFHKPSSHTAMEFARHVEQHWAEGSPYIRQLTQLYCRVRFGRISVTQDDLQVAETLLRELGNVGKPAR